MTKRLEEIFSNLDYCKVFADIGCDHGYISKAMLDCGKCDKVIISDVSAKCLRKAETLLADYVSLGKAESVVSDGFEKVGACDQALIAGMGGEEIISIISNAESLPYKLVLQPMKNVDRVRLCAVKAGYRVEKDYCFTDGKKYYDIIILSKGNDSLTADEIEFGRTNILTRSEAFLERNRNAVKKLNALLIDDKISSADKAEIKIKMERIKNYV